MGEGYRENMQANDVTTERLRRLAKAKPRDGGKVLSVYVDLEPSEFPTARARSSTLTSALDAADRVVREAGELEHEARIGLRSGLERVRRFPPEEFDPSGA